MLPLDPSATREYVLESDRKLPEDRRTVFILHPLKAGDIAWLQDHASFHDGQALQFRTAQTALEFVKRGLEGWKNGPGGTVTKPTQEQLDLIPFRAQRELATEIDRISSMTEEEEGNSSSR